MKLFIARDKDGTLCLYDKEPKLSEKIEGVWVCSQYGDEFINVVALPSEYFPEVTLENSPQKVELNVINK